MVISLRYVYLLASISLAMSAPLYSHEESNTEPHNNVIPSMHVVLCVLERNTIHMECYNLTEFYQGDLNLPKEKRSEHRFLELSMTDQGSTAHTMYWGCEGAFLTIETKRNKVPTLYYADPFCVFNMEDAQFADGIMVSFCDGVFVAEQENRELGETIRACQLCFGPEEHKVMCTVIFDCPVKSVCGMLIPSSVFESPLLFDKKLKKEEALRRGFLREMPVDEALVPVVESEQELGDQQRIDQAIATEQQAVELEPSHPLAIEATPEISEEFPATPKYVIEQEESLETKTISVAPESLFAEEPQETHKSPSEEVYSVSGAQQNLFTKIAYGTYAKLAAIGRFFNHSWSATKNYLFGAR
jgi:hypothetical protein